MDLVIRMLKIFVSSPAALKGQLSSVVKTLLTLDLRLISTVDSYVLQAVANCCSANGKDYLDILC